MLLFLWNLYFLEIAKCPASIWFLFPMSTRKALHLPIQLARGFQLLRTLVVPRDTTLLIGFETMAQMQDAASNTLTVNLGVGGGRVV